MKKLTKQEKRKGTTRAKRMYPLTQCNRCGAKEDLHRHHRDRNRLNNEPDNVEILCRACHVSEHMEEHRQCGIRNSSLIWLGKDMSCEKNHRAKLTNSEVLSIRKEYAAGGIMQTELAARYGVTKNCINAIVRNRRWRNLFESVD